MTTATVVPVTMEMDGDELDAEDAWHLVRRVGVVRLLVESFVRFRYADGFSHSRALAFQGALSVVPFMLALAGLTADIDQERPARVLARTIERLAPSGGSSRDALAAAISAGPGGQEIGELALTFGLAFSLASMTTAMAQVERGINRVYGIRRDRPALVKYGRALVLTALLAVPVGAGFVLLVAGGSFADAMADSYGWSPGTVTTWNIARWPVGLLLLVLTIAVLLDHAPRRRQPALSWLALGAAVSVTLSMMATGLLAVYTGVSGSFSSTYGPLAGMFALLIWSMLSSVALFLGAAVCAQLEQLRAGDHRPAVDDPGRPTSHRVRG